jgi:hypothetical protein
MSCAYKNYVNCKTCGFVVYNQCENYRYWRVKILLKDILPMNLRVVEKTFNARKVYFTRSLDVAKQIAASIAIRTGAPVKKFTLNQVISMTIEGNMPEIPRLVLIECLKLRGEQDKIQGVVESFVDKALLAGSTVVVYSVVGSITQSVDWIKVETC